MSSVTTAAVGAGALALGAYLDAKFLVSHDLGSGFLGIPKRTSQMVEKCVATDRMTVYHMLEDHALGQNANNTFLVFEGKEWTFRQFYDTLQRVGNWLMNDLGVQKDEIVGIDGTNSPEYLMLWFGLEAIGAVPAFLNCNLTTNSLIHCIKVCELRILLCDEDVRHLVQPCEAEISGISVKTVYYSASSLESLPNTTTIPQSRRSNISPDSMRYLMFTSGTTGLPKAVMLWASRSLITATEIARYLDLKSGKSRMYTCLPLYHGAAHGLCVSPSIYAGSTIILSRKFSHRSFWPEVHASQANIIQYVGELCRYLINGKPHPLERAHKVQMAWGNGMRPDVWEAFRQRFNIPIINELYAATDGLGTMFNYNAGPFGVGAIGKRGLIYNLVTRNLQVRVKMDHETEEMYRSPTTGFAIRCGPGEPGEVLHQLDPAAPNATFKGYYKNAAAGDKRMIRHVFTKGDLWFRSGDMQRQDADGLVYFVDRLGDTFRWKSENVSTNEVGDVVAAHPQIAEASVYGVSVPRSDGRAGCAAVVLADGVSGGANGADWRGLAEFVIAALPRYAVPVFIRVVKNLEVTGTMKVQKGKLKADGIDLVKIQEAGDVLYWLPIGAREYVKFKKVDWEALGSGKAKL